MKLYYGGIIVLYYSPLILLFLLFLLLLPLLPLLPTPAPSLPPKKAPCPSIIHSKDSRGNRALCIHIVSASMLFLLSIPCFSLYFISCTDPTTTLSCRRRIVPRLGPSPMHPCHGPMAPSPKWPRNKRPLNQYKSKNKSSSSEVY